MDEGTAALYAAIIGFAAAIIGAAVGGLASWKAARHGADAAVQAAVEQVNGQAAHEYAHWLRQERRRLFIQILEVIYYTPRRWRETVNNVRGSVAAEGSESNRATASSDGSEVRKHLDTLGVEAYLLASSDVCKALNQASVTIASGWREVLEFVRLLSEQPPGQLEEEQEQLLQRLHESIALEIGNFTEACRKDLAGPLDR
ncbi:hypothetical protein [Streptomyces sp. NPDC053560]|uniref:hypothetical protein n=1 Tax=Streptomyces sp. NPDC053560 TaxID=3365711 RepID=UPI0037CF80D6